MAGSERQRGVSLLEARGLTLASRSGEVLVDGVDLTVRSGEILALVGESGSGKSLTALALLGLLPEGIVRLEGQVLLDGVEVTGLSGRHAALRGRCIASIFQDPQASLDPRWTVGRYVGAQFRRHGTAAGRAVAQASAEMLARVGLADSRRILRAYPHELSGGMAQRVMIAGALAADPRFLVADEPTTALDVTTQSQILDLLEELQAESGLGILLITHDLGIVAEMARRVVVLYGGKVMETGAADAVLAAPRHPYTRALLASMPDIEALQPPRPIPGTPGDRLPAASGCPFQPRCGEAIGDCAVRPPVLASHDGRSWACHRTELPPTQPELRRPHQQPIRERALVSLP
ncbi:ABC transporter ATP-binding protein [Bosea sp. (in: a-proteobacteria)]|uniref:ABC transporter ATP-binding protein n=1 Tax=Bosea sp. (in: a-proteobacteria) TaxID=1871050 RepID=UPI0033420B6C